MKLRLALITLLALASAAAVWFGIRSAGQSATIVRLEAELRAARVTPPQAPATVHEEPAPAPGTPAPAHKHPAAKRLEVPLRDPAAPWKSQIQQLTADLGAAQAHAAELQLRVNSLTAERDTLSVAERDAREQLADLRRAMDTARAERAAIDTKLRGIETELQTLRQQSRSASQRSEELAQTATELQDVLRRQQTYVNNVVSRYREITDILRTPAAPAGSRDLGPDLVRAGSLISMTDEDLRAVRDLNARLALIQKRLLAAAGRR